MSNSTKPHASTDDHDAGDNRETLGLLPIRRGVLLPGTTMSVPVGRRRSVALVSTLSVGDRIAIAAQRDPDTEDPVLADLHRVGTVAEIKKMQRAKNGKSWRVLLEGVHRFELGSLVQSDPHWSATIRERPDPEPTEADTIAAEEIREHLRTFTRHNPGLTELLDDSGTPGQLADRIASGLEGDRSDEIEVLHTFDVGERLRLVARFIAQAKARWQLKQKIGGEVRAELEKDQRKHLLRQQLRAIQKELGEGDTAEDALEKLRNKLDAMELPEEVQEVVDRELSKMSTLNPAQPDAHVTRNYLEWISELPWDKRADVKDDLDAVAQKLDADHYGLDKVKERILEHLAVAKLSGNGKGTILCLAGPPGVGKTSLGQSIADATGRPFIRVALGGVRDEAEVRGHRRTYIGALPGRIINALRKVKVKNPVLMLDEVDKLGQGWMGSPESALLELLDPEQNHSFTDHYLELPFDMSEVMFVATANDLSQMSAPLRDRLEIISLSGYTPEEKRHIARDHLVPSQLAEHALDVDGVQIDDEALDAMIGDYTREAGVRQLKRVITKMCRALALDVVRGKGPSDPTVKIDLARVRKVMGKARFFSEVAERTAVPGVATGLAYTPVGGDILFIETSRMPGKGGLTITGQLGDVMQESAKAALSYVRSNAERLGVDTDELSTQDLHVHVPAGAIPKDGPSAGVTMFTALTSLLTGRRVRPDTAMTGECTLRGRVLPVGGIKEKVLAAHRAGITRVILPAQNERDLDDVPEEVREALEFTFAHEMHEVLDAALEPDATQFPPHLSAGDSTSFGTPTH